MNQFDQNHYRFQRHPDRTSWSYKPVPEPWWVGVLGGFVVGCVFALLIFLGI